MPITFPNNTTATIDAIRNAIGRNIDAYSEIRVVCSSCVLDPVTNTSTDSFCPTCGGKGYIITFSGTTLSAHITWNPSELTNWVSGGQYKEMDCRVQVKYTVVNDALLNNTKYLIVDGKRLRIDKKTYRGVQSLNRILLDLKEE
jgi:hypothetical protein